LTGLISAGLHLFTNRIVHRDLKPDNIIFLDEYDFRTLKLIDFGCALECGKDGIKNFKMPYNVCQLSKGGAYYYLPPEVINAIAGDNVFIDYQKCDVYSIGVVLIDMLSTKSKDDVLKEGFEIPFFDNLKTIFLGDFEKRKNINELLNIVFPLLYNRIYEEKRNEILEEVIKIREEKEIKIRALEKKN